MASFLPREGMRVRLYGLKGAAYLNGQEGVCEWWNSETHRWNVRLESGEVKAVKPINLQEVVDRRPKGHPTDNVKDVFRSYDLDGDGYIDKYELSKCFQHLNVGGTTLERLLAMIDKSEDGKIDYEEFVDWLTDAKDQPAQPSRPPAADTNAAGRVAAEAPPDDDEFEEEPDWTRDQLEEHLRRKLPEDWPSHGMKVFNNMHKRFPNFPVQKLLDVMNRRNYHGGKVMHDIRETGAVEVKVKPPKPVSVGEGYSAFPARYIVPWSRSAKPLKVYEQTSYDFNVQTMHLQPHETEIPVGHEFWIVEVKRGHAEGFCYGRISSTDTSIRWANLGLETAPGSLDFTSAERLR